jgi:hypothetical protein
MRCVNNVCDFTHNGHESVIARIAELKRQGTRAAHALTLTQKKAAEEIKLKKKK